MNTFTALAIASILCVLITGYVVVAFISYGAGSREAYKRGLDDGIAIAEQARKK